MPDSSGAIIVPISRRGRPASGVEPLARKPLREGVYAFLRRMIVQGRLEHGAKIMEGRVAVAPGVSRTPVREARHRLEREDEETHPIISTLEGLAVRPATPRLSEAGLRDMSRLAGAMARHGARGQTEKLTPADSQFHALHIERSENRCLQRILGKVRAPIERLQIERLEYFFFSAPEAVQASVKQHRGLVRVLRRRNARAAGQAMIRQWEWGRRALLRLLRKQQAAAANRPARFGLRHEF